MREVVVLCEGETERELCRQVLAPHLARFGVDVQDRFAGRGSRPRGGIRDWQVFRTDLLRYARPDPARHVGLLVDYYGLPHSWPARSPTAGQPPHARGQLLERALVEDLKEELHGRFHPCIQLHEFESLLFIDPAVTAAVIKASHSTDEQSRLSSALAAIAHSAKSVELINDQRDTCPSARIAALARSFHKKAHGIPVVQRIGLERLRMGCPWLHRWLTRLEALGGP
jgi:hypothetical protein